MACKERSKQGEVARPEVPKEVWIGPAVVEIWAFLSEVEKAGPKAMAKKRRFMTWKRLDGWTREDVDRQRQPCPTCVRSCSPNGSQGVKIRVFEVCRSEERPRDAEVERA